MPFSAILQPCLIEGTSFKESGKHVNVKPKSEECVRFYHIDQNPNCTVRSFFKHDGHICDLLVTYSTQNSATRIFCIVELKGRNIDDAISQVLQVYGLFKRYIAENRAQFNGLDIIWRSCIVIGASAPMDCLDGNKKQLVQAFGRKNVKFTRKRNNDDLGVFLRTC